MKLHSITTPIGAAILAEITAPTHGFEAPEGWGVVFWGRCDRATFAQIILSTKAKWIADYDIKAKLAVVAWPDEMAGKTMPIDTSCVDAICPECGSTDYISDGALNWRCNECDRQWRKQKGKRGRPKKVPESV